MTFYQRMRLRYGLTWRNTFPPMPWREILIIATILLIYGLAARIDHLGDLAAQKAAEAESNAALAQITLDCMNGANGFMFKDAGLLFECGKPL
jgi:hypothetical protein